MLESLRIIKADKAHEQGFFGRGVLIGVADTGIDPAYLELHKNLIMFKDFTGAGILDRIGHGTVVAALACSPQKDYLGVAPESKLAVARCLDALGMGSDYEIINACEWLASKNVNIINLSLGGQDPATDNDPLCREVNVLNGKGIVVVTAAGNQGPYPMTISAPGAASGSITVGATNKQDVLAAFSSRGPTKDQRVKPDCVAPGVDILVPELRHLKAQLWRAKPLKRTAKLRHYASGLLAVSGTSFASPLTAGSTALLIEAINNADPAEFVRTHLLDNCEPVKGEESFSKQKRKAPKQALPPCVRLRYFLSSGQYKWGKGRINVWKALEGVNVE